MAEGPRMQRLTGARLHLQHGPIDVVLRGWGEAGSVDAAETAAAQRFSTILEELAAELPDLRRPLAEGPRVSGPAARRMVAAVSRFPDHFVTPMAAVAGAVADEILRAMLSAAPLDRAYVNDGGDIALHVAPGERLTVGIAGDFSAGPLPMLHAGLVVTHASGIGGIATSGFQGRSFSLGIADSVTVLAADAAAADAAATLIANAVDVDHPAVRRAPARSLDPDSDLGERLVVTGVGALPADARAAALARGMARAQDFLARTLILAAALTLRGETLVAGAPPLLART